MMRYSYNIIVEYIPGKENVFADVLSRSTASPEKVYELLADEIESCAEHCASPKRLVKMRRLQANDEVLAQVLKCVHTAQLTMLRWANVV